MNFNEQQKRLIESTAPYTIGISRAGSGKTSCIVARIQFLHDVRGIPYDKMVAITFTNAMAEELLKRLHHPQDLKILTVHSYCNYLLLSGGVSTKSILDNQQFDELFELIKQHPEVVQPVEHLLLDEANDSTKEQFEFILDVIKPKEWTFVGDPAQEIFSFNGSDVETFINLANSPDTTTYYINSNYRNGSAILQYAKRFLYRLGAEYEDMSIPMRNVTGQVVEGSLTPTEAVNSLIKSNNRLKSHWGDWFVLCRTNADVSLFTQLFNDAGVPTDTFRQADLTNSELETKMQEDTVKILTCHSAKGLENKNVLSYNIRAYNDDEARLCYVAATRARDFLLWAKMPPKKKKKTKMVSWE